MADCFVDEAAGAVPIYVVSEDQFPGWRARQGAAASRWLAATAFEARDGRYALLPDEAGGLAGVVVVADPDDTFAVAGLPREIPEGVYRLSGGSGRLAVGWGLGAYAFERYRPASRKPARLVMETQWDGEAVRAEVGAVWRGRDLINAAAGDLPPSGLAEAVRELATEHGARVTEIVGDDLLEANFPMVHAVGRASADAPRLVCLEWGEAGAPGVALVGKGVCFDSGGLDVKGAANMRLMKKDMGGAAVVLGVAELIMRSALPVRLQLIIPAVENAIAGNAFHPGDVLATRKGLRVEIDNTDAEGRLVLGDALTFAGESAPQMIIDVATLTGAARIAMGTEVPAFFSNDDALAAALSAAGEAADEPIWRLPLHRPYRSLLDSQVADIANGASVPQGGAITAALFLAEFVPDGAAWAHFDVMGFNARARPGRPEGGEPQALRSIWGMLRARFAGPSSS